MAEKRACHLPNVEPRKRKRTNSPESVKSLPLLFPKNKHSKSDKRINKYFYEADREVLIAAFHLFDTQDKGFITLDQLLRVLKIIGEVPPSTQLKEEFSQDAKHTAIIDYEMFVEICTKPERPKKKLRFPFLQLRETKEDDDLQVKKLFQVFDIRNKGKISGAELKLIMRALGMNITTKEAMSLIEAADFDMDGHLDIDEFNYLLKLCHCA